VVVILLAAGFASTDVDLLQRCSGLPLAEKGGLVAAVRMGLVYPCSPYLVAHGSWREWSLLLAIWVPIPFAILNWRWAGRHKAYWDKIRQRDKDQRTEKRLSERGLTSFIGSGVDCAPVNPMKDPIFKHLNQHWNAEPNAPEATVTVRGSTVRLRFFLNPWAYAAEEEEKGCLSFQQCSMWRLGSTNDEGWYAGQCRYSKIAPAWGEFYELIGEDEQRIMATDWHELASPTSGGRHFLFYFRDNTFECFAAEWSFERSPPSP
jgi:hypothetical protein